MATNSRSAIPKVCKENWLQMDPSEKARFCNLCQKNVFEYSQESTSESDEVVCLRFQGNNEKAKKHTLIVKIANLLVKKK